MHIKIQLIVLSDDDQEQTLEEVVTLEKEFEHLEQIGLTLTESKTFLSRSSRRSSNVRPLRT